MISAELKIKRYVQKEKGREERKPNLINEKFRDNKIDFEKKKIKNF